MKHHAVRMKMVSIATDILSGQRFANDPKYANRREARVGRQGIAETAECRWRHAKHRNPVRVHPARELAETSRCEIEGKQRRAIQQGAVEIACRHRKAHRRAERYRVGAR